MHHLICGLLIFAVGPSKNWGESPQDSQISKLRENPGKDFESRNPGLLLCEK